MLQKQGYFQDMTLGGYPKGRPREGEATLEWIAEDFEDVVRLSKGREYFPGHDIFTNCDIIILPVRLAWLGEPLKPESWDRRHIIYIRGRKKIIKA